MARAAVPAMSSGRSPRASRRGAEFMRGDLPGYIRHGTWQTFTNPSVDPRVVCCRTRYRSACASRSAEAQAGDSGPASRVSRANIVSQRPGWRPRPGAECAACRLLFFPWPERLGPRPLGVMSPWQRVPCIPSCSDERSRPLRVPSPPRSRRRRPTWPQLNSNLALQTPPRRPRQTATSHIRGFITNY